MTRQLLTRLWLLADNAPDGNPSDWRSPVIVEGFPMRVLTFVPFIAVLVVVALIAVIL